MTAPHGTAVILAGGLGTRLRSVVADRPKVLAEVAGRPVVTFLLDQLAAARIARCVLCTGHLGGQVAAALGPRYGDIALEYSEEPAPLGTAGALRHARPRLGEEPVLVLNGDSYCHVDLAAFARAHDAHGGPASLVVVRVPDASRYGRVTLGADDRVAGFEEKGGGAGGGWINAGIYRLAPEVLAAIPDAGRPVSLEREVLPALVARGLRAVRSEGPFLDIGTPASYAEAGTFFAGLAPGAEAPR